ncbi:MAG TPA: NAD(P)H-dependent oxidoreductase [Candidatus Paceibacterota bacterium]|nr:NAD(P)H-dependent oxidoreductase [Candidatus Paceibacterota bacterium]
MADTPLKILVIIGSVRRGRYAEKPAAWMMSLLSARPDVQAELIDLKDWPLPFFDEALSPSMNKGVYENPLGRKWADKVASADAFIMTAAEYNHGYTAVLKNALDWASSREWANKPVAFVGYGSVLGARSVEQLRLVSIELGLTPIRSAIHIPADIRKTTSEQEGAGDPKLFAPLDERGKGLIDQLVAVARALKPLRS